MTDTTRPLRRTPFSIQLNASGITDLEELIRRYINSIANTNPEDAHTLQNLNSRVNGTKMRANSPNQHFKGAIRGQTNTQSYLVNLRTNEERDRLKDAAEWGLDKSICPHVSRDVLNKLQHR